MNFNNNVLNVKIKHFSQDFWRGVNFEPGDAKVSLVVPAIQ